MSLSLATAPLLPHQEMMSVLRSMVTLRSTAARSRLPQPTNTALVLLPIQSSSARVWSKPSAQVNTVMAYVSMTPPHLMARLPFMRVMMLQLPSIPTFPPTQTTTSRLLLFTALPYTTVLTELTMKISRLQRATRFLLKTP